MNIQVATSEIPVPAVRGGSRLSGNSYAQRTQSRFRGNRGSGSVRGNLLILFINLVSLINLSKFFYCFISKINLFLWSNKIIGRGARRGGRGGSRQATKTPTAEELDAELEAYVKEVK